MSSKRDKYKELFNRGYSPVRKRVSKGSKYTMSCYNCDFYYQAEGDSTECCQNPNVLEYDMVVTESSIYCNQWRMCARETSVKKIFKKQRK